MTSAILVQCSNQLSYEVTQLRPGQFVGLMFSRKRNVVRKMFLCIAEVMGSNPVESPEFFRFTRQLLKLSSELLWGLDVTRRLWAHSDVN